MTKKSAEQSIQRLTADYHGLMNLKRDSKTADKHEMEKIMRNPVVFIRGEVRKWASLQRPPSACWNCGACHFARFCGYKLPLCQSYGPIGILRMTRE